MANALLVVMDGLGDRGRETPLSKANTPNLNKLVPTAAVGVMYTLGPGKLPGSDTAHLALFGYDPDEFYRGRGPFEALGAGVALRSGDVSFRANLCTIDEKMIILDRRAGRADYGMDKIYATLDNMKIEDVTIRAIHTVEHRGAVVFCGPGLAAAVSNTDPHETDQPVSQAKGTDPSGEKIARIMNAFTRKSYELLKDHPVNKERTAKGLKPANMAVLRGAGLFEKVPSLKDRFGLNAICIAGGHCTRASPVSSAWTLSMCRGPRGRPPPTCRTRPRPPSTPRASTTWSSSTLKAPTPAAMTAISSPRSR
jgi:2,3-bisphosphoglycerate-independent phosphoglycerate mutase